MKPIRLKLSNVHSFAEAEIDFADVNLAVLSGVNGSGKSTVACDSILFALFGETRGPLDSIIRSGEEACRVEFTFALGGEVYLVSRQRSRKGAGSTLLSFQFLEDLDPEADTHPSILDGKSVAETQAKIESVLHMNADLLRMTAFSGQGDASAFSSAKPAERKQVLADILDLTVWERRAEVARQQARDLDARIASMTAELTRLREAGAEVAVLEETLARIATEIAEAEARQQELAGALQGAQGARAELLRAQEADTAQRRELERVQAQVNQLAREREIAEDRLEDLSGQTAHLADLREALAAAEAAHQYSQELEAKRQEVDRLTADLRVLEGEATAAKSAHTQAVANAEQYLASVEREYQQAKRRLTERIESAQREHAQKISHAQHSLAQAEKQAAVLGSVPCASDEAMSAQCPLIEQALQAREALGSLRQELEELQAIEPASEERDQLRRLKESPSPEQRASCASLKAQDPLAELRPRAAAVKQAIAEIGYDASEHAATKRQAGRQTEAREALARAEQAEALAREVTARREALCVEIAAQEGLAANISTTLGPGRDWAGELSGVDATIGTLQQDASRVLASLQTAAQTKGQTEQALGAARDAQDRAEAVAHDLAAAEKRVAILKLLATAFGKQGIPALLMEQAVPELEAAANEVLTTLSDGSMSLALRSQRETKAKTLSETLEVIVADERGERPYESFSGGESMRVDLALRVGLSLLLANRAGARCETLVLDETCAPLDEQGRALFVESLQRIADRFATILVVTHIEALKDMFPTRFEITKTEAGSQIRVA